MRQKDVVRILYREREFENSKMFLFQAMIRNGLKERKIQSNFYEYLDRNVSYHFQEVEEFIFCWNFYGQIIYLVSRGEEIQEDLDFYDNEKNRSIALERIICNCFIKIEFYNNLEDAKRSINPVPRRQVLAYRNALMKNVVKKITPISSPNCSDDEK